MRTILVVLAFVISAFLVLIAASAFAGGDKAQGQPFQYLQQQIDELKAQIMATQGAIRVSDDTGQFIGTLVGVPSSSSEHCTVFIPQLAKFTSLSESGQIPGNVLYMSNNCSGTPYLSGVNDRWLRGFFNGVDYSFYTGGNCLGTVWFPNRSVRRSDGTCEQVPGQNVDEVFEAVELPSSEVPFVLPLVTPYHYE